MDRRSRFIVTPKDDALIREAENAARRRRATSNVGNRSSLLRQLADGLRRNGLTLDALDDASLKKWSGQFLPGIRKISGALRQLEEYREEERAKNNRQAGEGSSHQAAPVPMEGFDQGEVWGGVDQYGQASAGSFNSAEFWAGVDQAGRRPPVVLARQTFGGPAQSVNQSSPPMSDQGPGSWLFGLVELGQYFPPNWDDGIQADETMLRQMHWNNVLPSESREMTTFTVRGQHCTAIYYG
ncbi:hypothetical protein ACLMJV_33220, partial [Sinorhizobium meliloti]